MSWDAEDVALLKKLWAVGESAAQIARRLGYNRNAVCAKQIRLDLKRGHKPPTAKPKIVSVPKRKPALLVGESGRTGPNLPRAHAPRRSCLA
jgi:GcrA cell cycle regulator